MSVGERVAAPWKNQNANCIHAKISQKDARATEFLRTTGLPNGALFPPVSACWLRKTDMG